MDRDEQANNYLKWINDNYEHLTNTYKAFCNNKKYQYDEDIFSSTYLKIYEKILKDGLEDTSITGYENYTFKAFKQNLQREKQYSRNKQRDGNITDINGAYEDFYNRTYSSTQDKLISDLYKDFSILYLLQKAEENYDSTHLYLFKLKFFYNLTYKDLQAKTGIKGARQKVIDVKHWLQNNVTKEEIKKAFEKEYGNFLN